MNEKMIVNRLINARFKKLNVHPFFLIIIIIIRFTSRYDQLGSGVAEETNLISYFISRIRVNDIFARRDFFKCDFHGLHLFITFLRLLWREQCWLPTTQFVYPNFSLVQIGEITPSELTLSTLGIRFRQCTTSLVGRGCCAQGVRERSSSYI